jgi:hypothetical protein
MTAKSSENAPKKTQGYQKRNEAGRTKEDEKCLFLTAKI